MLKRADVEGLRRSLAMAPLSESAVHELLETCDELVRQRAEIEAVLRDLPDSFAAVRGALNRLQRIVGA